MAIGVCQLKQGDVGGQQLFVCDAQGGERVVHRELVLCVTAMTLTEFENFNNLSHLMIFLQDQKKEIHVDD